MRRSPATVALLIALGVSGCGPEAQAPAGSPGASPSSAAAAGEHYPILIPGGDEVDAGHVRFRLVSARLDRHESADDGSARTLALRVSLRATELASQDTHLTADDLRLLAGGRAYPPAGAPNVALWASQSVDLDELVFVVPAPLATASLQVGTSDGGSALLALRLPR